MANVKFKSIESLFRRKKLSGDEKIPVSGLEYVSTQDIADLTRHPMHPDEEGYLTTDEKGIRVAEVIADSIRSEEYGDESGFAAGVDAEGKSFVEADRVEAREGVSTQSVRAELIAAAELRTPDFKPGMLGGAGGAITRDADGGVTLEVDNIVARRKVHVNEVIINQSTHVGGRTLFSAANMECVRVEDGGTYWRCYFDTKNGQKANLWKKDDLAYFQQYSADNTQILRYYWRLVTSVGEDWINLSKSTCDVNSGTPAAGDNIVQVGNLTDRRRQSMLEIDMMGASRVVLYAGISTFSFVDRNEGALGVDEQGEPYFYVYGDAFIGDRNLSDPQSQYITFQTPEGETRRRMIVSADLRIGSGSTGLTNLSEWQSKQAEIDRAGQAAAQAQEKVENLQVGDRNLLLQSNKGWDTSEYRTALIELGDYKPKAGEECTLVVKGRLGEGKVAFAVHNSSSVTPLISILSGDFDSSGIATKTFPWNINDSYGNTSIHIYPLHPNVVVSSQIEWAKLVVGNKTSAVWTPAPEDVKAEIDGIQFGGVNLIPTPCDFTLTAEASTVKAASFVTDEEVQGGDVLTFNFAGIELLSGTTERFHVGIHTINTGAFLIENTRFTANKRSWTFTIPQGTPKAKVNVSIYAGVWGQTAGNTVKYSGATLVRGTKPMLSWSPSVSETKAQIDGIQFGGVNLVPGGKEVTVVAGSNNYAYCTIPIDEQLKKGDVLTLHCHIEHPNGSAKEFRGSVMDKTLVNYLAATDALVVGENTWVATINSDIQPQEAKLLLYAGKGGSTAGNTVRFTDITLTRGTKPMLSWSPSVSETKAQIDKAQSDASAANAAIAAMNDDGVLDISEKQSIRTQWEAIQGVANTTSDGDPSGSYKKTVALSGVKISTEQLTSLYTTLRSYLDGVALYANTNTSDFARTTLANHFKNYYNEEAATLDRISKSYVDGVQIGGVNFALDTAADRRWNAWGDGVVCKYLLSDNTPSGEPLIVRFTTTNVGASPEAFGIGWGDASGWSGQYFATEYPAEGKTFEYRIPKESKHTAVWIYFNTATTVHHLHVQSGNKPTDWLPAPEDVKAQIDGIQPGDRNLLLNSAKGWKNSDYNIAQINIGDYKPSEGEECTIVIKAKPGVGKEGFTIYNSGGGVFMASIPSDLFVENRIVSQTFKWSVGNSTNTTVYIFVPAYELVAESQIEWVKLVVGNKTSAVWTPAPEDVKADAEQAAEQAAGNVRTSAVNYLKDSRYDNLNHWITGEGTATLVEDPKFGTVVQYQRTSGSGNFQLEADVYNRSQLSNCDVIYYVIAKNISGDGIWAFGGWPDTVNRLSYASNSIDLGDGWKMYWVTFKSGATLGSTFGINSITGTWQFYAAGVSLGKNPPSSWTIAEGNLTDSIEIVNSVIADIASDNKLTASEKQTTYNEWQMIAAEYPSLVAEAQKLNINTANYTSVYTALDSYLKPLVSNLSTTSDIDGNVFRAKFKAYYDAKIALMQQTQGALSDGKQMLLIDASGLDTNTYYPLTFKLLTSHRASIRVSAALSINTAPWASHHSKTFSLDCKWSSIGGGWGSNYISRYVEAFRCRWTLDDQTPVGNIGQHESRSLEYIYVRGGGTYSVQATNTSDITLHKQGYVDVELSFSIPTLPMSAIVAPKVDIDDLHLTADQSKQRLDRWASDDIISPVEKTGLRQQRAAIEAEYAQLKAEAERYSVSTQPYEAAYNAAIAALDKYTQSSPAEISVDRAEYARIAAYYTAAEGIRKAVGNVMDVNILRNDIAKDLGYADYAKMSAAAETGQTIIKGGKIRTELLDASHIVAMGVDVVNGSSRVKINPEEGMTLLENNKVTAKFTGTQIGSVFDNIPINSNVLITEQKKRFSDTPENDTTTLTLASGTISGTSSTPVTIEIPPMRIYALMNLVWSKWTPRTTMYVKYLVNGEVRNSFEFTIQDFEEYEEHVGFDRDGYPIYETRYRGEMGRQITTSALLITANTSNKPVLVQVKYSFRAQPDPTDRWDNKLYVQFPGSALESDPVSKYLGVGGVSFNSTFYGNGLIFSKSTNQIVGMSATAGGTELVARSGSHGLKVDKTGVARLKSDGSGWDNSGLLCGYHVDTYGGFLTRFGIKDKNVNKCVVQVDPGRYRLTHNIGHTDYVASVIVASPGSEFTNIGAKSANYIDIEIHYGNWDFGNRPFMILIFGRP